MSIFNAHWISLVLQMLICCASGNFKYQPGYKLDNLNSILSEFSDCQIHVASGNSIQGVQIEIGEIEHPITISVLSLPPKRFERYSVACTALVIILEDEYADTM